METLINSLLRPYRSTYTPSDLGHKTTAKFTRTDSSILNERDLLIRYSYFTHKTASNTCIVYCHCNSGSRIEGMAYLQQFIERGWNVCLFDFSGSGHSQGEFISLGHFQSRDLDAVIKRVRELGNKNVLLWGRSMGAATIIFYLNQAKYREEIAACVLDSPYASLWELIKQIGVDRSIIPGFILEHLLDFLRAKIKEQHLFDIKSLEPMKCVANIDTPLLFITSNNDEFVRSQEVVQMYQLTASKNKQLQYIDKSHNSNRDASTIHLAIGFLSKCLAERQKKNRLLKVRGKNLHLNGGNMAQLIIKAQKQRSKIKRMKSELQLNKSFKQNKSKYTNLHLKTQFSNNPSVILGREQIKLDTNFANKKKAIKFSLAHLEIKKKSTPLLDSTIL